MDRHVDPRAKAREGLVDRVVDDLVDEMVQPAARHRPDVHRRPAPHRLQTLQDLDGIGLVVAVSPPPGPARPAPTAPAPPHPLPPPPATPPRARRPMLSTAPTH